MVLESLKAGDWIVSELLSMFDRALVSRLGSNYSDVPVCFKTAVYYGIANSKLLEASPQSLILNSLPHATTSALVSAVLPGRSPTILDGDSFRRADQKWEGIQLCNSAFGLLFSSAIKYLAIVDGHDFKAASTPLLFGCLIVTPNWLKLSAIKQELSLVHELAHHELFLINATDRLAVHGKENSLIYSPLQRSERPLIGRLHSAHALFRMIQHQQSLGLSTNRYRKALSEICSNFEEKELTPFAFRMINEVYLSCL